MLEAPLFSAAGERAASFALPTELFDGRVHEAALYQAVVAYRNNQRQGTAATKTRGQVSGGNQKPWRQKGTGRARQGSIRAPQWRGGGVVFGPTPRDYRTAVPERIRRLARRSALNARAREGALLVIEPLPFDVPKTRQLAALLATLGVAGRKVLLLTDGVKRTVYLSGRNLPSVRVMPYAEAAAYDILWSDVLLVERSALGGGSAVVGSAPAAPAVAPRTPSASGSRAARPRRTKPAGPKVATPAAKRRATAPRRPAAPKKKAPKKKQEE
jgi:large subunit ribosomal protein L4